MKAIPLLTITALITSLLALFLALRSSTPPTEAEINRLVDARLTERELKFVQAYAPKFREMFVATEDPEFGPNWNPKSLEELVAPLVRITSGMATE